MNLPAKSGHVGIQLRAKTGLYRARVRSGPKQHEVGEFKTIAEAVAARAKFVERLIEAKGKP